MPEFSLDLPYYVPLADGDYSLNVSGLIVSVVHTTVEHEDLDARLGGIQGNFGFARDQFGLLRFSNLSTKLEREDLTHIAHILLGGTAFSSNLENPEIRGRIALAALNQFLDRYRAATRKRDIRPVRPGDLARLHQSDLVATGEHALYGGGITLPVVGINPEAQQRLSRRLLATEPPCPFELGAMDALQALEDGRAREALVVAASALETAVDTYLARIWRLAQPRKQTGDAASFLKVRGAVNRTIDDVLEASSLSAKVKLDAIYDLLPNASLASEAINAIEVRNLVLHGGVEVSPREVSRNVIAMTTFVLDYLVAAIERDCPTLPRPEFLYAYEEALGTNCRPEMYQLVADYLTGAKLTAKLYNRKVDRNEMFAEQYGGTIVIRCSFQDFDSKPDQINLFIARSILHHWLRRRGDVPYARVASQLFDEEARDGWKFVAGELTRAIWGVAIDRQLIGLGFEELVERENTRCATYFRKVYGALPVAPASSQQEYWIDYLKLAQVASTLSESKRDDLLKAVTKTAPTISAMAKKAMKAMAPVNFSDNTSILEALVAAHDVHKGIIGSILIFDPQSNKEHGLGSHFEDIFKM